MQLSAVEAKSILSPADGRGFLGEAITHTLNPNVGCSFGSALCGTYCYAQHLPQSFGRGVWGTYLGTKTRASILSAYERGWNRLQRTGAPLRILMSSVTDPYVPQERQAEVLPHLYRLMQARLPDALIVQTRSPLVLRDVPLLQLLAEACHLIVKMTVETDRERLPGFPPHATPIAKRIDVLRELSASGIATQAVVSPMLPIENIDAFLMTLLHAADRLIIDHYLVGDGSRDGARTRKTPLPSLLDEAGYGAWNTLDVLDEVYERACTLAPDRVLFSRNGFLDLRAFHPSHRRAATDVACPAREAPRLFTGVGPGPIDVE